VGRLSFELLTERVLGCHFLDRRVLQKGNVTRLEQAPEGPFEPSVWIRTGAPAAWNLSNAQLAQFVGIVTLKESC
jgi:hypothetical protein